MMQIVCSLHGTLVILQMSIPSWLFHQNMGSHAIAGQCKWSNRDIEEHGQFD